MNTKFQAVKSEEKLRLDMTSPLAGHLFSLTTVGEDVEYLMVKKKTHVTTTASAYSLRDVIPVNINPTRLINIFFAEPITDKNWTCTKKDGQLFDCIEQATKIRIEWEPPVEGQRLVKIDQPSKAKIQISISEFDDKIAMEKNPFELKVPSSFKSIKR